VIFAHTDILSGIHFGSTLANNDIASKNALATKFLYTKSAASRVATVSGTTACFFMCHFLPTFYLFITAIAASSFFNLF
jgi:hypothetical protein